MIMTLALLRVTTFRIPTLIKMTPTVIAISITTQYNDTQHNDIGATKLNKTID